MKHIAIKNTQANVKLGYVCTIFNYKIFAPIVYTNNPFSRYKNNCPLWIMFNQKEYDVVQITNENDFINDLIDYIRRYYPITSGYAVHPPTREYLLTIGLNIQNFEQGKSVVVETHTGEITDHIIVERQSPFNKYKTGNEWRGVDCYKIVSYKFSTIDNADKMMYLFLGKEPPRTHDSSVVWCDDDQVELAIALKLIQSEYGFFYIQGFV